MVLLIMMYDLEKASKSASSISLYVSDDPRGSDEVLGPAGAVFPDQEAQRVIICWTNASRRCRYTEAGSEKTTLRDWSC